MTNVRSYSGSAATSLLALGCLAFSAGCNKGTSRSNVAPDVTAQTAAVNTVQPERKTLRRIIEQPAFVEAFEQTPLSAAIPGYVQKVHVDSGDRVKGPRFDANGKEVEPGQILAELWVPEREQELKQKKALVAQAAAEVDQAIAALEAAEANIVSAKALVTEAKAGRERAQANYNRWKTQYAYEQGLKIFEQQQLEITLNQREAADAARKEVEAKVGSTEALVRESEAKRNKAKADIAAAQARVQVAQAEEGRVAALLEYTKIRAPYDGVITSRDVHTGYYLTGAAMKPLFVIARMDLVRIVVDVPEADAVLITDGTPARIRCQVVKDQEFEGKVTRSSWSLDPKARTLRAQIDLASADGCLRPGMYTYVSFHTESAKLFTLPAAAVVTQGDQAFCFQAENGKAVRTPIKVGARNGQFVQVLKKQAKADSSDAAVWQDFTGQEQVVASNVAALTDGQAVTIEPRPKN